MKGKELKNIIESNNLTASEASDILGVSRGTLYNWFKRDILDQADILLINSKLKFINLPDNQVQEPGTSQYSESSLIKQVPFTDFMETEYLSIEAQAGYLDSLESQHVPKLETMLIPKEFEKGNYLVIEIKGDSMNDGTSRSIQDGDKLLCKELQKHHWTNKLHFNQYLFVIASTDGIVCKQVTKHDPATGSLNCHSWNPNYKDYVVNLENVYKLFYVKKIIERRIKF